MKSKKLSAIDKKWDEILSTFDEANFLQSRKWEKMNELVGHKVERKIVKDEALCLMIIKDAKRGKYLEIPGGPLLDWSNEKLREKVIDEAKKVAKENNCAFIRLRPQLDNTPENIEILKKLGAKPSPMHLHAEHTIIIDLTQKEDDLLANMRRQTRYDVRKASKLNIKVTHDNSEALFKAFHQVQAQTAARQHFIPPSETDLLAERTAFAEDAQMYVASTEDGQDIAYGLILKHGNEADYFEAASTDLNRKLPGAAALQWQVIKDLKAEGYKRYNLWGIAPQGQPNHRYAKVTTFKMGFGGELKEFVPAHDIVISKIRYIPTLIIEKIRKKRRHLA